MSCDEERELGVVRRDIALLVILALSALPAYLLTRALAGKVRQAGDRVAAEWRRRGEGELAVGDAAAAVGSLRHAAANDRGNPTTEFALARALLAAGHLEEARRGLTKLRENAPENPEINVELARLAVRQGDLPAAVLAYHRALYGVWSGEGAEERRRRVRTELVRYLLLKGDHGRALSEILTLAGDVPPTAEAENEIARLFLDAGEPRRAQEHFLRAARRDDRDAGAWAGAGRAALLVGDDAAARRFLARALERDPALETARKDLALATEIRSADPLAPGLTPDERFGRLVAAFDRAETRAGSCIESLGERGRAAAAELERQRTELRELRAILTPRELRRDPEFGERAARAVFRIEESARSGCGEATGPDEALFWIGRKHEGRTP